MFQNDKAWYFARRGNCLDFFSHGGIYPVGISSNPVSNGSNGRVGGSN